MSPSNCQRSLDELLVGADPRATEEARAHVDDCPSCKRRVEARERVAQVMEAPAEVGLDDLKKARLQARLLERIAQEPDTAAAPAASSRRWAPWALAATVLLALGAGLHSQRARLFGADTPRGDTLVAYVASGAAAAGTPSLGTPRRRATPGPGGVLRLAWYRDGERLAILELHGGEVALGAEGELLQRGGLLLAQVAPQRHRRLMIRAGATTVTVLGTVFAVDSRSGKSPAVGVLRGRVAVEGRDNPRLELGAGEFHGGVREGHSPAKVSELPQALRQQLQRHARATKAPRGPRGTLILSGSPAGVEVHLGGISENARLGRSPLVALVPTGTVALRLSAPKRTSANLTVEVKTNDATRLGYALALRQPRRPITRRSPPPATPPTATPMAHPVVATPRPRRVTARPRLTRRSAARRSSPSPSVEPAAPSPKLAPAPRQPPAPPAPPTAAELYRRAEAAMGSKRDKVAVQLLEEIVKAHAKSPEAASALFELGRRAAAQGAHERARALLGRAERHPRAGILARAAHFQRCRVASSAKSYKVARRCLRAFLGAHPRGGLASNARLGLLRLALRAGDCDAARARLQELRASAAASPQVTKLVDRRCPIKGGMTR